MPKYKRRVEAVHAVKFSGSYDPIDYPRWVGDAIRNGIITFDDIETPQVSFIASNGYCRGLVGDYMLLSITGEIYAIEAGLFEDMYEEVS